MDVSLIKKKIIDFKTIIIHGHIRPDGDCYGSQFGLKNIIMSTFPDKKVYVVGETNDSLSFVGKIDKIEDDLYQDALVIVVDSGNNNLVSDQRFSLGKEIIWIDHHLKNDHYMNFIKQEKKIISWIEPSFSSCSEMIFVLNQKIGFKLNYEGALAIYIGIVTDSGGFKYDRVNSNTFLIAAELLKYGLDVFSIDKKVNQESLNFLKYKSYIIENFVFEDGISHIFISQKILKKFNLNVQQALAGLNILENLKDNLVWILILEKTSDFFRVSLRSLGPDIYSISKKFKGGGHKKACGLDLKSADHIPLLLEEIKKSVHKFKIENKDLFYK